MLDVHANTTDTPAIRLEQNNSRWFHCANVGHRRQRSQLLRPRCDRWLTSAVPHPARRTNQLARHCREWQRRHRHGKSVEEISRRRGTTRRSFVRDRQTAHANYALINFGTNSVVKFLFGLNADSDAGRRQDCQFIDIAFSAATAVMTFTGGNVGIGTTCSDPKVFG